MHMKNISARTTLSFASLLHVILWSALPMLMFYNPPLDMIEGVTWGRLWEWGYEKHPPLAAWITQGLIELVGTPFWKAYFILSPACVALCLLAVWKTARLYMPQEESLLATLLLLGCYYYHFTAPEFNPNMLLLPLWAWFAFVFYHAVMRQKASWWLATAALAGLSMLAKYTSALPLAAAFLMLVFTPEGLKSFKNPWFYLSCVVFIAIIALHLLWALENQFSGLKYLESASHKDAYSPLNHVFYPIRFIYSQFLALFGLFLAFFIGFGFKLKPKMPHGLGFRAAFPWVMGLAPVVLTLLFSLLTASKIKSMWGTPLWSFSGLLLFLWLQPRLSPKATKRLTIALLTIYIGFAAAYPLQFTLALHKRGHFPGNQLSEAVSRLWYAEYASPLPIIGGGQWFAGNVAFFSPDTPKVYDELNPAKSNGLNDKAFLEKGGVILWEADIDNMKDPNNPRLWKARFPNAKILPPLQFAWPSHPHEMPILLGVALIPPAHE